jgi:hypothetical protein
MNRQFCFGSVLLLSLSVACSSSRSERDGGRPSGFMDDASSSSEDSAVEGREDTDGPGNDTDNDACARLEARPQPKASAVWFVFDPLLLDGQVASNPKEQTNREMLQDLLFKQGGIVPRLEDVVQFGLASYYVPPIDVLLAGGRCPEGATIEAKSNNAQALSQALADIPGFGGSSWAALESIATAIAAQKEPTVNTILMVHRENDAGCDLTLVREKQRAAVKKVTDQGATVSTVAILYAQSQAPEYMRLNMETQALSEELAKLGGGQAFASNEAEAIRQAIERSVEDAVSCEIALQGKVEAGQECQGEVLLGGETIPCNDANGFSLRDASTLELQGTACKRLREDTAAKLSAHFPCDVFTLL